ncbi:MAG TPA: C1 family peptidase [Bacteroidota bacterium]|nr:C1 family peptidase [Bacteroidota bacterium]
MTRGALRALVCLLPVAALLHAQTARKDTAVFTVPKNEFLETIRRESDAASKEEKPRRELRMSFEGLNAPGSPADFTQCWHNPPVSQGLSGMCWCFSATSYFESEVERLTGRKLKLSELYTVYWEYVEKAREFVRTRGESEFGEGSESNAVVRIWKQYGVVPGDAYTGLLAGRKYHDHTALIAELRAYLMNVKAQHAWNEETVLGTVRGILDHELGAPPATVQVDGRAMTPAQYLAGVVRLHLDDYVELMSLMESPYYARVEYAVPDNWWHCRDYCNVPLEEFMRVIRKAVRSGHTICIGGDTSEPGLDGHAGVAVIPTFDIPPDAIDESARQFRFSNGTTGDDHGIHIVGYAERGGKDWYLVKDSGSGSRNNSHPGYYFYREDYVRLKMLTITVHRDLVKDILAKIPD